MFEFDPCICDGEAPVDGRFHLIAFGFPLPPGRLPKRRGGDRDIGDAKYSALFPPCSTNCRVWAWSGSPTAAPSGAPPRGETPHRGTQSYACSSCPAPAAHTGPPGRPPAGARGHIWPSPPGCAGRGRRPCATHGAVPRTRTDYRPLCVRTHSHSGPETLHARAMGSASQQSTAYRVHPYTPGGVGDHRATGTIPADPPSGRRTPHRRLVEDTTSAPAMGSPRFF